MKTNGTDILTAPAVALYLGIEQDEAKTLFQREGFPSTEVAPGMRVVRRDLLEQWVLTRSRGYKPPMPPELMGG